MEPGGHMYPTATEHATHTERQQDPAYRPAGQGCGGAAAPTQKLPGWHGAPVADVPPSAHPDPAAALHAVHADDDSPAAPHLLAGHSTAGAAAPLQ